MITIVLMVSVPRFENSMVQNPTKKVTRWMTNTARTLRSQALEKHKIHTLVVDVDENRMWMVSGGIDEAGITESAEKAFVLPGSIEIADVLFPHRERITTGMAEINFYPAGYSDQALIRLEDDEAQRFAFLMEPLLPKVKFFDEWITF